MHIVWVFLIACLFGARSERIVGRNLAPLVLHTKSDERVYNFFPLRTNLLQFSVKANHDILIALSNTYDIDSAYYEIVIGGWGNSKSAIRRDNAASVVEHNGTVITREKFQDFWIAINHTEGSISVGKAHGRPFLYYRDPDYVKMSYFGVSTGYGSGGQWNFDFELLRPHAVDGHHHIDPRYETIEAN